MQNNSVPSWTVTRKSASRLLFFALPQLGITERENITLSLNRSLPGWMKCGDQRPNSNTLSESSASQPTKRKAASMELSLHYANMHGQWHLLHHKTRRKTAKEEADHVIHSRPEALQRALLGCSTATDEALAQPTCSSRKQHTDGEARRGTKCGHMTYSQT